MKKGLTIKKRGLKLFAVIMSITVLLGVIGLLSAFKSDDDTIAIKASAFSIGSLNSEGKYQSDDQSLYTPDSFGAYGLTITPDFESNVKFDVFYYDSDGNFVKAVTGLTDTYVNNEVSVTPMYVRIVIHPYISSDDKKDFKINFLNKNSIANLLNIEVAKSNKSTFSGMYDFTFNEYSKESIAIDLEHELHFYKSEDSFALKDIPLYTSDGKKLEYLKIRGYGVPEFSDRADQNTVYATDSDGKSYQVGYFTSNTFDVDLREYENLETITIASRRYFYFYFECYYK